MLDLTLFFKNSEESLVFNEHQIGAKIIQNPSDTDEIDSHSICVMHIPEYRGDYENNSNEILNFRNQFYQLYPTLDWSKNIYDLGNLLPGENKKDSFFALEQIISHLLKKECIPIIIGGSQDLTYPMAVAYESLEQLINICCIDEKLDLGQPEEEVLFDSYVGALLFRRPCYLFNHATIGVQPNRNNPNDLELFDKLFFDICKLGEFNSDFKKAEPILRNSDLISVDLNALKSSERLTASENPNGFTIEQLCQISKYSGISDKSTSFGIFNSNAKNPIDGNIVSHLIWYFIDGVENRKGDFPIGNKKDYMKFTVILDDGKYEIIFYKSNRSERWWMEVPYPPNQKTKFERHHMIPCNRSDYENAMQNEMPDLWWKTYQKLG